MSEIPLLRESDAFVKRLMRAAARDFKDDAYRFYRRVNWSYRFIDGFYQQEAIFFQENPRLYLEGGEMALPSLENVWDRRLSRKQTVTTALKVGIHWLFRLAGLIVKKAPAATEKISIYRKAYVDDIELVYDPEQKEVLRAIYPFAINFSRQLRYLRFLCRKGSCYKLTGLPYSFIDLLAFLRFRTVASLRRLESRAQLKHATEVMKMGVHTVQLSDEFDLGSFDFCRLLRRYPVSVINSAHGVGKYFPVHAYQEFHTLTRRQQEYYSSALPCVYGLRRLNDRNGTILSSLPEDSKKKTFFVFLSQNFRGVSDIIKRNEVSFLDRISSTFKDVSTVRLLYRSHPNCHDPVVPEGFTLLRDLSQVNGLKGTIFASFFSTCQIDPAFKGRKVLIRGELIYPEIAFDDTEEILDIGQFIDSIHDLSKEYN